MVDLPDASKFDADDEISEAQPELKILVEGFRTIAQDYNAGLLGGVDSAGQLVGISQNVIDVVNGDTGTFSPDNPNDVFNIAGGTGVTTSISGDTLTIDAPGQAELIAGPGIQIDFEDSAGQGKIGIGNNVDAAMRNLFRVSHRSYKEAISTDTLGDSAGESLLNVDFALSNVHHIVMSGDLQLVPPANMEVGASITIIVEQDATGGHSLTFFNHDSAGDELKFPGGQAGLALSTAAGSIDIIHIYYMGSQGYLCNISKDYRV
jgi:hypothetical protein